MRVVRLMGEPDWQSRLSPIEEIFFATSPSAKTLRPDERQPFKKRWLGRYGQVPKRPRNVVAEQL
ncbi:MAG: hypothetical protein WA728_19960 [Xanthobacteraceae bacterium]